MSSYTIKDTTLTAIGDAIRGKNGASDTYTPAQMATAIAAIETGITPKGYYNITENGTYNVTEYAYAVVDVLTTEGGSSDGTSSIVEYVRLTNGTTGAATTHAFDASEYIGTEDNQKFYIVAYTYSASYSEPVIWYYDGSALSEILDTSGNTKYSGYYLNSTTSSVASGVITIGANSSCCLSDSSTGENAIYLFYVKNGATGDLYDDVSEVRY